MDGRPPGNTGCCRLLLASPFASPPRSVSLRTPAAPCPSAAVQPAEGPPGQRLVSRPTPQARSLGPTPGPSARALPLPTHHTLFLVLVAPPQAVSPQQPFAAPRKRPPAPRRHLSAPSGSAARRRRRRLASPSAQAQGCLWAQASTRLCPSQDVPVLCTLARAQGTLIPEPAPGPRDTAPACPRGNGTPTRPAPPEASVPHPRAPRPVSDKSQEPSVPAGRGGAPTHRGKRAGTNQGTEGAAPQHTARPGTPGETTTRGRAGPQAHSPHYEDADAWGLPLCSRGRAGPWAGLGAHRHSRDPGGAGGGGWRGKGFEGDCQSPGTASLAEPSPGHDHTPVEKLPLQHSLSASVPVRVPACASLPPLPLNPHPLSVWLWDRPVGLWLSLRSSLPACQPPLPLSPSVSLCMSRYTHTYIYLSISISLPLTPPPVLSVGPCPAGTLVPLPAQERRMWRGQEGTPTEPRVGGS